MGYHYGISTANILLHACAKSAMQVADLKALEVCQADFIAFQGDSRPTTIEFTIDLTLGYDSDDR
jgi:hypothetical protein